MVLVGEALFLVSSWLSYNTKENTRKELTDENKWFLCDTYEIFFREKDALLEQQRWMGVNASQFKFI